ncbi:MAG: HAMP domain-containing protein [Simkaniaceae bacterium]|nr:HAMP domain-containing protein [Simkaniaceae bacterium]
MKLFLLVGGTFALVLIVMQVLENWVTNNGLWRSENRVKQKLIEQSVDRSKEVNRYLQEVIGWKMDEVDVLQSTLLDYSWQRKFFEPSAVNEERGTWLNAATLLFANKTLDFIQVLDEDKVSSMVMTKPSPMNLTYQVGDYGDDLIIRFVEPIDDSQNWRGPYVAIPFHFDESRFVKDFSKHIANINSPDAVDYFFMYSIDDILYAKVDEMRARINQIPSRLVDEAFALKSVGQMRAIFSDMVDGIERAQKYLRAHPNEARELAQSDPETLLRQYAPERIKEYKPRVITHTESIFERFMQIRMIWQMAFFFSSGLQGFDPFTQNSPIGISHVIPGLSKGIFFFKGDIFYPYPMVCADASSCAPKEPGGRRVVPYYNRKEGRLFLLDYGQLFLKDESGRLRRGSLTLGVDIAYIINRLALATSSTAVFAEGDKVLQGFNADGMLADDELRKIPLVQMLDHDAGVVDVGATKMYYIQLTPMKDRSVRFFLMTPAEKEFATVRSLIDGTKNLSRFITFQTSMVGLVALILMIIIINQIVRNITGPIVALSEATKAVGEGNLEEVELPPLEVKSKDEIDKLYESFNTMVVELKEKERVRGALNKVVSPVIAEEILKGNVQLGGEEKVVTVLFADIRHFSEITEKMDPKRVIEELNSIMTKISSIIDEFGGVIDKYVGDEVMALFGAPVAHEDSAVHAVEAGVKICKELSEHKQIATDAPIKMGVGIHTGVMLAGNMGAENRLNYTVLGANVNLCSRLCGVAKEDEVIISEDTLNAPFVRERIEVEQLEPTKLKGFTDPVTLYRVVGLK